MFSSTLQTCEVSKELHPALQDHVNYCVDELYFNPGGFQPIVLLETKDKARQQTELFKDELNKRLHDPELTKEGYERLAPKEALIVSGKTTNEMANNLFKTVISNTPGIAYAPQKYTLKKAIITLYQYGKVDDCLETINLSAASAFTLTTNFSDFCEEPVPVIPALHPYNELFKTDSTSISWYYKNQWQYYLHPCFLPFAPFYFIQDWWNKYYRKHTAHFHTIPIYYDEHNKKHAEKWARVMDEEKKVKIIDLSYDEREEEGCSYAQ